MHLGALAVFTAAPGVSPPDLLELLGARAAAIPRLRMRVRDVLLPVGGAAWFTDKDFDVHRHVRQVVLPEGDFMAEATRLAGELMEQPLGRGLPPWQMYLLRGAGDGTFAVLVKLHHALADGMRAVAIGAGIFDQIATAGAGRGAVRRRTPVPPRSWLPGPYEVAGMALDRIGGVGRALGVGASVVRASRLDLRGSTALTASSSGTRRLATAELDAETVQRIRRAEGGTANDVLLAVVAGALRRWMLERGEQLPGADPRALVPVSRRRPGGATNGNRLSAYLLGLPVAEPDARERLRLVRTGMNRNKAAGPMRGAGAVAVLADQLPALAHRFERRWRGTPPGCSSTSWSPACPSRAPRSRSAAARCVPSTRWHPWPVDSRSPSPCPRTAGGCRSGSWPTARRCPTSTGWPRRSRTNSWNCAHLSPRCPPPRSAHRHADRVVRHRSDR